LQKPRPLAQQVEGGFKARQPLAQTLGVGRTALGPVIVVFGRVGQVHQADQQFQAGDVQVHARPVQGHDVRVGHLPRSNDTARAVAHEDGDPWFMKKVEAHQRLSIEWHESF